MRNTRHLTLAIGVVFLVQSALMAQQPIPWEATLDNAQRLAGQTNRLVLIQFWAPWCKVCPRMEAEVYSQPAVAAEIAVNYVPVKINADNFPATAQRYSVSALPTTVITTPQGQLLDSMRGRIDPAEFSARLNRVASNAKQQSIAPYAQMPVNTTPATAAPTAPVQAPPTAAATPPTSNAALSLAPGSTPPAGGIMVSTESRYADFMQRTKNAPPTPIAQPSYAPPTNQPVAASQPPIMATQPSYPALPQNAPQQQLSAQHPTNPILPSPSQTPAVQSPAGAQPLGLDGYCSVTLAEKQQWVAGDRRWGAIHRGRTYLFTGPEEQRRFFADPDRYAPAVSGNDVVLAAEQGRPVPGMREHGVFYNNRVFLFSSENTLEKFARNPAQYATQALGAMRTTPGTGTALQ